nr:MAG TPA: Polyhedrin-roll, disulfide bond, domain swapping.17A [Caudoviricetes sp.]
MVETNLKEVRNYLPHEVVRIVNPKQQLLYVKNNVYPIDIYTSIDDKTDNAILAMVFLKSDTTEIYQKWCNYDLV